MVIAVAGALALGDWLEATSVVFLFAVAQWLEVRTLERARQAIRALIDLTPREALVRRNGRDQRVPVDAIALGDEIVVRPGEKIPLDGVVVTRPQRRQRGADDRRVAADRQGARATRCSPGRSTAAARWTCGSPRLGRDTRLAHIIHLVEDGAVTARAGAVVRRSLRAHLYAGWCLRSRWSLPSCRRWSPGATGRDLGVSRARAAGDRLPVRARDLDARVDRRGAVGGRASRRARSRAAPPRAPRGDPRSSRSTRPAR